MNSIQLPESVKRKMDQINIDANEHIDTVTKSDVLPAKPAFPSLDISLTEQVVCPMDECHWRPCPDCDVLRSQCRYHERHPIHLDSRSGFILMKQRKSDGQGEEYIRKVSYICACHPAYN